MILLSVKADRVQMSGRATDHFGPRGAAAIRLKRKIQRGNFESVVVKQKPLEFNHEIFIELKSDSNTYLTLQRGRH